MPQTFPHINDLVQKLHETHDIAVAVELANAIMDVLNVGTQWKMQEPAEIYDKNVIPKRTFRNEKQQDWFCEHAFYPGQRVALYHFCEEAAPYESKFYQLNKNATKAVVAAGVMLTPNWEDSTTTQNSHYKVGIDFFLNNTDDGLLMVSSNKFNLRVLEFKEKLTNTQIEILNNLSGLGTIKGLDKSGNFVEDEAKIAEPELEPQRAIHKKLWESLALKTINKKFYAGIAEHFSLLYQNMKAQGFDETKSKVFATRLIGRILFCWFLAKKNIVKSLPEHFDTYDKLKVLFYDTLNTPVSERKIDDVETPYLNGGLFEMHADDLVNDEIPFPENWLSSLYDHLQEYNFTTDESSPEYQQVAIDPEMLGCVFESLLGQIGAENGGRSQRNDTGAFYTPREIVQFICKSCLREHLYSSTPDAMHNQVDAILDRSDSHWLTNHSNSLRDVKDVREKVLDALRSFKVLDPACGSGAFPMGMLQLILKCRQRLDVDSKLKTHEMKKEILGNNIFGVDINPMAAEISRLRAWLSLMVDVDTTSKQALKNIEPLPNLDFKFVCANTLVSLSEDKDEFGTTSLFANEVDKHASMLANARNEYFSAKTPQQKASLKQHYFELRDDIKLRRDATGRSEKNEQLATWDPFDTSTSCEFFDSTEMFSIPKFDCVIGNPPYVGEKGNRETFQVIKKSELGKRFYMGKMDLFYFFFHKGIDLLKKDGVLCYITTNYFPTANGAKNLREDLKERTHVLKLVNFNEVTIFDSAKGQHDMITLLKKTDEHDDLEETEQFVFVKDAKPGTSDLTELLNAKDESIGSFRVQTRDKLFEGDDCFIRFKSEEEFENIFAKMQQNKNLTDFANVNQGIVTGADKFSASHKRKHPNVKANVGDPIFVYPAGSLKECFDLEDHLIKPWFKNSDIHKWVVEEETDKELLFTNLILEDRSQPEHMIDWFDLHQARIKDKNKKFYVLNYLQTYREILEDRREFKDGERPWDDLHRARSPLIFDNEKIVCPQRAPRNRFAYCASPFYASADVYFITAKEDVSFSPHFLLGVLNSDVIYLWLYKKGKRKGEMLELYQTPVKEIPIANATSEQKEQIETLVKQVIEAAKNEDDEKVAQLESEINTCVNELYGLSDEEVAALEKFVGKH